MRISKNRRKRKISPRKRFSASNIFTIMRHRDILSMIYLPCIQQEVRQIFLTKKHRFIWGKCEHIVLGLCQDCLTVFLQLVSFPWCQYWKRRWWEKNFHVSSPIFHSFFMLEFHLWWVNRFQINKTLYETSIRK